MEPYQLTQGIISLSQANTWDRAKLEWSLKEVYEAEEPETCLCGQFPIIEVCVIANKTNGNETIVGNICVKKFLNLPSDKIFQAIKRIRIGNGKSLNAEALEHAHKRGWINDWEQNFYFDIMRKRNLSEKQLETKEKVHNKVLKQMKRT